MKRERPLELSTHAGTTQHSRKIQTMAEVTAEQEALRAKMEENLIAQEYKIWKKNTPFLYDFVMTVSPEPMRPLRDGSCAWRTAEAEVGRNDVPQYRVDHCGSRRVEHRKSYARSSAPI